MLPLLGFSPKILGLSIESWVLGIFPEGRGFSRIFQNLGFFLFFSDFTKKYIYLSAFCFKVRDFKEFGSRFWPEKSDNLKMMGKNVKLKVDD